MSKGVTYFALLIAVVALIFSGANIVMLKGEKGDAGMPGVPGSEGGVGQVGPQGPPGENGTQGEIGPMGPKGNPGPRGSTGCTGAQGSPGIDGEDGIDCLPNELPIVALNDINGTYSYHYGYYHHKYVFRIDVTVDDPEDDNMHITFYWRKSPTDKWTENDMYIGTDGTYTSEEDFWYHTYHGTETLYWLVECWDGSDLSLNYYNYTVIPPP